MAYTAVKLRRTPFAQCRQDRLSEWQTPGPLFYAKRAALEENRADEEGFDALLWFETFDVAFGVFFAGLFQVDITDIG